MTEIVKRLNDAETERVRQQVEAVAQAPAPRLDATSGQHFVWAAFFDGTNNDKDHVDLSGNPLSTNVAQLWKQAYDHQGDNFKVQYFRGVGTDPGLKGYQDVLNPTADQRATAIEAFERFSDEASTWLRDHPNANPEEAIQVVATGFSRGSGTMPLFSQLLYEQGLTDPKNGKSWISPGRLGLEAALVLDPVTTGYRGNDAFSPTSKNINVVAAANEYRTVFKLADHTGHPQVHETMVTGNHCGIGGGIDNGIGALTLEAGTRWWQGGGMLIANVPPERRFDGDAIVHHERKLPTTETLHQASESSWLKYNPSQIAQSARTLLRGAAELDYPVTHDPKDGLDAPRERAGDTHEAERNSKGWSRFEGVSRTLWQKTLPDPANGQLTQVTVVQGINAQGVRQSDMYALRVDEQGRALGQTQVIEGRGANAEDLMRVADRQTPGTLLNTSGNGPAMNQPAHQNNGKAMGSVSQQLMSDSEQAVGKMAQKHGLNWDTGMENTVHAVAATARQAGMTRVNLMHVQGNEIRLGQHDGFTLREARLDAHQAANTPQQQSLEQLQQADTKAQMEAGQAPAPVPVTPELSHAR